MAGPDWVPVLDAFDVVPHPVPVYHMTARCLRDPEHAAVDVHRYAAEHVPRRFAETLGPAGADKVVVAADPTRGNDHRLSPQGEFAGLNPRARPAPFDIAWFQQRSADTIDRAAGHRQSVDPVPELERDLSAVGGLAHPALEWRHHAGAGTPDQVESRHRVSLVGRAVATSLGPPHYGKKPDAHLMQPGALLA